MTDLPSVYENTHYKMVVDYVLNEDGDKSPYQSYLVINKTTGVVEATHNVFCAARDMSDDFSNEFDKGSKLDRVVKVETAPDSQSLHS